MTLARLKKMIFSSIIAGTLTFLAYFFDHSHLEELQINSALEQAKQIQSQADTLYLYGLERKESSPLTWAVQVLSVGGESRPVHVSIYKGAESKKPGKEDYTFDSREQVFKYSKMISPETGEGIQVQIQLSYLGFLGADSTFLNDLWVAGFFFIFFLGSYHLMSVRRMDPGSVEFKKMVLGWISRAKTVVTELGRNIKLMIENAHLLAKTTLETRKQLDSLHQCSIRMQKTVKDMENIVFEEEHKLPRLEERLARLRDLSDTCARESEIAFRSCDQVAQATHDMTKAIAETTSSMAEHLKLLKDLKGRND